MVSNIAAEANSIARLQSTKNIKILVLCSEFTTLKLRSCSGDTLEALSGLRTQINPTRSAYGSIERDEIYNFVSDRSGRFTTGKGLKQGNTGFRDFEAGKPGTWRARGVLAGTRHERPRGALQLTADTAGRLAVRSP